MKEWEIWMEGWADNGGRSDATLVGKAMGETFDEAILNFRYPEDEINTHYVGIEGQAQYFHRKGDPLPLDRNKDGSPRRFGGRLASWACRYFDNEADARKSFG